MTTPDTAIVNTEYSGNRTLAIDQAGKKEYGYRGGQILIVAEIGSGGGTSFVKPASQSRSDLIGKIGAGTGGAANRSFSADEPLINNGYGSITADSSDSDNNGTPVSGGPRTTAEEYGDAPSANGVDGELLAERPAGAQPAAPREEYRNRSGLSIVTMQGNSVVTVNPTAFQTPDSGQGGAGVSSQINTGHGSTITASSVVALAGLGGKSDFDARSARWSAFQSVSGAIVSVRLKFNWSVSGSANAGASEDGGSASSGLDFKIDYSLNGGSGWTNRVTRSLSVGGNDNQSLNTSGSEDILLSPGQNITQVQVRDYMNTGAAALGGQEFASTAVSSVTTEIWGIRLEVELDTTAPAISSVAAVGVTSSGATITWTTNENSDSQVEYGTSQNYGQSTTLNPALVTAHSQGLSGLNAGTEYHYRVKSRDAAGNLAFSGDFTFTTAQNGSAGIKWLVTDHLGSTRMVIDQTGSLAGIKRHDFLPFGEELGAGVGIRSASLGYGDDLVRQKFTGKERDAETGLDYFLARYHSSIQGRFTSVDPENAGAIEDDPQSWNGYAYAGNNPLLYSDPDGMNYRICSPDGKECYNHSDDDFNAGRRAGKKDGFTFSGDGKYFEKGEIRDKDGNVIATYEQTSLDEPAHQLAFEMQRQFGSPDLYKRVAANLVSSAVISVGFRSIKPVNLPNRKKVSVEMEEVESGHMTGGVRAAQNAAEKAAKRGKDMFPDWTTPDQAKRAILDAYTHSKVVRTQGTRVVLQGVTKDGTVIEMWFNRTTNVIETAYPKGRASQ